jgi:hypothetical protein
MQVQNLSKSFFKSIENPEFANLTSKNEKTRLLQRWAKICDVKQRLRLKNRLWVRIQKPYDIVSYDRKAVCPYLFATLPNVFADENFKILTKYC